MRHHPTHKRRDPHRFLLDPLGLMGPIMLGHPLPIVAIDAPQRDRRTHHICRQGGRQTLLPWGDVPLLDVGHKAMGRSLGTRIHQAVDLVSLHRLPQHRQQRPLPRLAEHGIWEGIQRHPLLGLLIPAATGGNAGQRRVVLPIAAMGLEHHEVAAFEGVATDPARAIIQTADATASERTPHGLRRLRKRWPEYLRHGQDDMTLEHALMEPLADLAAPVVDVDFGAASAQR